jgi:hypothetical protein
VCMDAEGFGCRCRWGRLGDERRWFCGGKEGGCVCVYIFVYICLYLYMSTAFRFISARPTSAGPGLVSAWLWRRRGFQTCFRFGGGMRVDMQMLMR